MPRMRLMPHADHGSGKSYFCFGQETGNPQQQKSLWLSAEESRGGKEVAQEVSATFLCWDGSCACQFSGAVTRQYRQMASKRKIYFGSCIQRFQFRVLRL